MINTYLGYSHEASEDKDQSGSKLIFVPKKQLINIFVTNLNKYMALHLQVQCIIAFD